MTVVHHSNVVKGREELQDLWGPIPSVLTKPSVEKLMPVSFHQLHAFAHQEDEQGQDVA
jgi:hypothetical protein